MKKLVITTINIDAFKATGHVLPASYIINLTQAQIDFIKKLESDGLCVDRVFISEETSNPK